MSIQKQARLESIAAVKIQNLYRGSKAKDEVRALQCRRRESIKAACTIQKWRKDEIRRRSESQAAVKIQAAKRRSDAQKTLKDLKQHALQSKSATKIQAIQRARSARKSVDALQRLNAQKLAAARVQATIKLQASLRGHIARKSLDRALTLEIQRRLQQQEQQQQQEQNAALKLQAARRGSIGRREAQALRESNKVLNVAPTNPMLSYTVSDGVLYSKLTQSADRDEAPPKHDENYLGKSHTGRLSWIDSDQWRSLQEARQDAKAAAAEQEAEAHEAAMREHILMQRIAQLEGKIKQQPVPSLHAAEQQQKPKAISSSFHDWDVSDDEGSTTIGMLEDASMENYEDPDGRTKREQRRSRRLSHLREVQSGHTSETGSLSPNRNGFAVRSAARPRPRSRGN